jgi:sugar phosphate isomerase/epimerase
MRLKRLKDAGADYVELSLAEISEATPEILSEVRADLSAMGLRALRSNGFFPGTVKLCGEGYRKEAVAEYTKRALSLSRDHFDIDTYVLGSSKSRYVNPGEDFAACMSQLQESFGTVGDIAAEFGVTVTLEHLNHNETNTLITAKETAQVIRELSHPNIMLMIDYFHFTTEREQISVIENNGNIIRHLHIAAPGTRLIPHGEDGCDYTAFRDAARKIGYDGTMSIESIYNDESFEEDAKRGISFIKSVFN